MPYVNVQVRHSLVLELLLTAFAKLDRADQTVKRARPAQRDDSV